MQRKKNIEYVLFFFTTILIIACALQLSAAEKSKKENSKKTEADLKEGAVFDSCGKDSERKCEKGIQLPVTDYSKSLK